MTVPQHQYSDNICNMRIAILGIYPPPFGGVSVHIERVSSKLKKQNNKVFFFNTEVRYRYKLFFFYVIKLIGRVFWCRPQMVFYHSSYLSNSIIEMMVLAVMQRIMQYKLQVVEHDCKHMYKRSTLCKKLLNTVLKYVDKIIFIGDKTYASYVYNKIIFSHFLIESSFLPPNLENKLRIVKTYPQSLFTFLKSRDPILLINAFQLRLVDGQDLYGINQTIQLLIKLKKVHTNIGLVIALAGIGNQIYFEILQKKIKNNDLYNSVYWFCGQKELWPLFKHVDVFVRPTLWDSFGISIAEALHFGIPAIASNVCVRPKGTILFDINDKEDFLIKVITVLQKDEKHNKQSNYLYP